MHHRLHHHRSRWVPATNAASRRARAGAGWHPTRCGPSCRNACSAAATATCATRRSTARSRPSTAAAQARPLTSMGTPGCLPPPSPATACCGETCDGGASMPPRLVTVCLLPPAGHTACHTENACQPWEECEQYDESRCGQQYSTSSQAAFCDIPVPSTWPALMQAPRYNTTDVTPDTTTLNSTGLYTGGPAAVEGPTRAVLSAVEWLCLVMLPARAWVMLPARAWANPATLWRRRRRPRDSRPAGSRPVLQPRRDQQRRGGGHQQPGAGLRRRRGERFGSQPAGHCHGHHGARARHAVSLPGARVCGCGALQRHHTQHGAGCSQCLLGCAWRGPDGFPCWTLCCERCACAAKWCCDPPMLLFPC